VTAIHVPRLLPEDRPVSRLTTSMAVAVAAIALLNLADLVTTYVILRHPGAIESNPLSSLLLANGWVGLIKGGVIVGLVYRIPRRRPTVAFLALLWFVAGFYFLTVVSNLLALQRLG
jgi:hypothetical protein